VNAIVLQAWEAAHGQRRDLVIGTTGPDGFHAHAWLDGDPVVPASEPGFDTSVLAESRVEGGVRSFSELLRRPAPQYGRAGSGQAH
jgi:hypothetical protein